jgi:hypothetical protein
MGDRVVVVGSKPTWNSDEFSDSRGKLFKGEDNNNNGAKDMEKGEKSLAFLLFSL